MKEVRKEETRKEEDKSKRRRRRRERRSETRRRERTRRGKHFGAQGRYPFKHLYTKLYGTAGMSVLSIKRDFGGLTKWMKL